MLDSFVRFTAFVRMLAALAIPAGSRCRPGPFDAGAWSKPGIGWSTRK